MKPNASKNREAKARIWGLTGGIASGKSTAARFFSEAGVLVIDADQVARELRAPGGAAHDRIQARFGTTDAEKLRALIFSDPEARSDIETILHPLIREESRRRIQAALAGKTGIIPVMYEAALLVETGRFRDLDGLVVVSASDESRIARLIRRDRCSKALARKMIASQLGDAERRAPATFVIENNGSLEDFREQVSKLLARLKHS